MTNDNPDEKMLSYIGPAVSEHAQDVLASMGTKHVIIMPFEAWEKENELIRQRAVDATRDELADLILGRFRHATRSNE